MSKDADFSIEEQIDFWWECYSKAHSHGQRRKSRWIISKLKELGVFASKSKSVNT